MPNIVIDNIYINMEILQLIKNDESKMQLEN